MSKHLSTVQAIYAAFGKGDVPAFLEHLSEEIAWEYQPITHDIPWLQPRSGRDGVAQFLAIAATELQISKFQVEELVGNDRLVVAVVDIEFVVASTGRRVVETGETHLWHFDERGRVIRFRHDSDTYQHWRAFHDHA